MAAVDNSGGSEVSIGIFVRYPVHFEISTFEQLGNYAPLSILCLVCL